VLPTVCPARSTGGNITLYAGNQLLAPLNCIQWTGEYGDASSVTVATTAPDPVPFNADLSAQALLGHLQGTNTLPADRLATGEPQSKAHCRLILAICRSTGQRSLSTEMLAGSVSDRQAGFT